MGPNRRNLKRAEEKNRHELFNIKLDMEGDGLYNAFRQRGGNRNVKRENVARMRRRSQEGVSFTPLRT